MLVASGGCSLDTSAVVPPGGDTGPRSLDGRAGDAALDGALPDAPPSDSGLPPIRMDGGPDAPLDSTAPTDTGMTADTGAPVDTGMTCMPSAEVCNGRDDDCDGAIDEEGCSCDRVVDGSSVYLFCASGESFDTANSNCTSWGYHVVYVNSAAEQSFVWGEARSRGVVDWWIGMTDTATEGRYLWLDGTVVWADGAAVSYHSFRGGDPGANSDEDCIEMDGPTEGMWADGTCTQIQPYVCEL